MVEFFQQISSLLELGIDYIVDSISQIISVIILIGKAVVTVFMLMAYLPMPIKVLASAIVAYVIVINILNVGG